MWGLLMPALYFLLLTVGFTYCWFFEVVRLDKGFGLFGAETGQAMFGRYLYDLQSERPETFTNTFGERRQPDARFHPISAMDITDGRRFHFRGWDDWSRRECESSTRRDPRKRASSIKMDRSGGFCISRSFSYEN
jgi:hypothetical protein